MYDTFSKQQTILIVDDAKTNLSILSELLKANYKIRLATSGEKALEICFSENPPDLVLLDIIMPEISGYEVCKRLKESTQTRNIPVIFITGKVTEEDEVYGFFIGAVDYIVKPFNPIIVKARVNTHAEHKRYQDYLKEMSYVDGLTGIPNRRKFDENIDFNFSFAIRNTLPISMVIMDIDYFKLFNDYYGHQAGDECIKAVAKALSEVIMRKTEFVARIGGEEFACVLLNANLENTLIIAEKLRESVMNLQILHEKSEISQFVSISIGVANIIPAFDSNFEELIKNADEALYISKSTGRNKVSSL